MNMKSKLALSAILAALPLAALANTATPSQPNGMVMCPCCQMMMPNGDQSSWNYDWQKDMKAMQEQMVQMQRQMSQMQPTH